MSDDKESDERYQIGENDKEVGTDDIEILKLGKFSSQKNIDNIEKESDKMNWMYMIDEKKYDERDQIGENDEYILTNDIDSLKLGTLISQKNIKNIDK